MTRKTPEALRLPHVSLRLRLFGLLPQRIQREVREQRRKEKAWPTILRGRDLFAYGPEDVATAFLEEAVQNFPDNAEIRLLYGLTLLPSDREGGVREVRRAVELDPYEPRYLIPTAWKIFDWDSPELARDYAARAREMGGENSHWGSELVLLEAHFALEDGDEEAAEAGFRLALEREPESEWFAIVLARFLADRERQDEALEVVQQALRTSKYKDTLTRLETELSDTR
jgi:tetratricopeptide (TPR) repeat protein